MQHTTLDLSLVRWGLQPPPRHFKDVQGSPSCPSLLLRRDHPGISRLDAWYRPRQPASPQATFQQACMPPPEVLCEWRCRWRLNQSPPMDALSLPRLLSTEGGHCLAKEFTRVLLLLFPRLVQSSVRDLICEQN
mmetsp:Transcript_4836/g.14066  ORF Transcript_4836/g.14066 Transcript_4836/m.14066 type:complete len:134 (-) Transcript_4836:36-437(-)